MTQLGLINNRHVKTTNKRKNQIQHLLFTVMLQLQQIQ